MNNYEQNLEIAAENNILVIPDYDLDGTSIKGLYCDGTIALSNKLETTAEKACILAEEIGHHFTSVGNIIDISNPNNAKQERHGRLHAYNRYAGLIKLVNAFEHGCSGRNEIAEHLEVTEEFLQEAVDCYRDKYGICTTVDSYVIYFIPHLMVGKII